MADLERNEDHFANIERYYKNASKLSKKDQEFCERWETAFALLRTQKNKVVAKKKYKAVMLKRGFVLSDNDVFRDFINAVNMFAPMSVHTKEFIRMTLTESIMARMELQHKRAIQAYEANDFTNYEKMIKLIQKDEEILIKTNGLDTTDPDMPDFSKVEMTQINVNINSENSKIFQRILGQGAFDMNEITDADEIE
jgi:hypothetical protein